MTIEELAAAAGVTTRNIRNHQTQGLLPPPAVAGRVGYYGPGHLARLRLVTRLQQQGFSLAGIAELLRAWEEGRSLGDVLGFEAALTAPWVEEEPERRSPAELLQLFPEAAGDPRLVARALELGLIVPKGDAFEVPSPTLLRVGAELVAAGIPLGVTHDELAALRDDMARVADRFIELFEHHVWRPFAEAGMPAERLPAVTDALRRLRPLAAVAVRATLARAMEEAVARSTAVQVGAAQIEAADRDATDRDAADRQPGTRK